jgi:hypothetical protein
MDGWLWRELSFATPLSSPRTYTRLGKPLPHHDVLLPSSWNTRSRDLMGSWAVGGVGWTRALDEVVAKTACCLVAAEVVQAATNRS